MSARSLLFVPGDSDKKLAKIASFTADVVIIDLEDAVAPPARDGARQSLAGSALDPDRTVVRVNPVGSADHDHDLAAVDAAGLNRVMLAKSETAQSVSALAPREVVVLLETPIGVSRARELVAPDCVVAAMWGAEDLVSGLGGSSSRHSDTTYRDVATYARSRVLVEAKAAGRLALDSVVLDLSDTELLAREARDAVAVGFDAKVAIHPSQVPAIRTAYTPDDVALDWARRLLAAAGTERGVFTFEGRMVDAPVFRQAERILRLAGR